MSSISIIMRSRPNKNGTHPLQLCITMGKKSTRLNIGKSIASQYWDEIEKCVKKAHPNYRALTNYVLDKLSKANKEALLLEVTYPDHTLLMLKQKVQGKKITKTFFATADEFFETLELAGKVTRAIGEKPAINHLRRFVKNKDLEFNDLTTSLMIKFKAYLIGKVGVSERSSMNYLTTVRIIYKIGINEGFASEKNYPFGKGKISIKIPESLKIGLDDWEVEKMESLILNPNSLLNHARNVWLFSFYFAGMRVSDVLLLRWSAINNGRLHYTMGKNKKPGSLIIPKKAQAILDILAQNKCPKYDLVFPDMRNVPDLDDRTIWQPRLKSRNKTINKYLKILARTIKLNKPLTMHIARHTFGNIAGDKISLQKLQKLYRHSSIVTTINYQKAFMNQETDDALETVVNFKTTKKAKLNLVA